MPNGKSGKTNANEKNKTKKNNKKQQITKLAKGIT